jgi:hypothetical protein
VWDPASGGYSFGCLLTCVKSRSFLFIKFRGELCRELPPPGGVARPTGQLGTPVSLLSIAAAFELCKKRAGAADCPTDSRVGSRG